MSAGAWAAATAAAVYVSWLGVHRVLGDGLSEQPRMLAAVAAPLSTTAPPLPATAGTPSSGSTSHASSGTSTGTGPSAGPSDRASASASTSASASGSGYTGQVQAFNRPGGRIVVDMGAASATLVTATPDTGWSVHQWTGVDWLRVDFEQGSSDSIFYVTWNGHPPLVQTWGP